MQIRYSILSLILLFSVSNAFAQPGSDYPTYDPSQQLYIDLNAKLLAEEIKQLYGGEHWNDSLLISFDFVAFTKDDVETARYRHEWNRLTDEATFSGTLDDGRTYHVHFSSYSKGEGTMVVDSIPVPDAYLERSLKSAHQQLTKNIRWLLLPVQLLDSNVILERLKDTAFAGKTVSTLKASFIEDSTISSEAFILYVNTTHKNIERWRPIQRSFGQDYIWRLYRRVGPFLMSTKRWADDFKTYIKFENIEITALTPDNLNGQDKSKALPHQESAGAQ